MLQNSVLKMFLNTFPSIASPELAELVQSRLASTGDVVLYAKISIGSPGVVAGCEDDATNCLYLADHTGDCWGGHDAILTNNEMTNLQARNAQFNTYKYTYTKREREDVTKDPSKYDNS